MNQEDINELREEAKFVVDVKKTLWANCFWFIMFIFISSFIVIGILKVSDFTEEGFRLMYLIFIYFITFKLLGWLGHPTIYMKEKLR